MKREREKTKNKKKKNRDSKVLGQETILSDAIILDTCHYTFVKNPLKVQLPGSET